MKMNLIMEKRRCIKCGMPLSVYNPRNDCFHHKFLPDKGKRNKILATGVTPKGITIITKDYFGHPKYC